MSDQKIMVRLFGPIRVVSAGKEVLLNRKKARALLLYLCRRAGTDVPRETICGLLWPDSGEEQARASLRQTLSQLRKSLRSEGANFINSSPSAISVRGSSDFIDVDSFEADGKIPVDEKIDLYTGDLAEGLSDVSPEFDRWLETERRVMRTKLLDYLRQELDARTAVGEHGDALAIATRMIEIDPLQEHIHRAVMTILAAQGRFDAALKQYEKLGALLQLELGVQPDTPTRELASDIRKRRRSGDVPSAEISVATDAKSTPIAPGKVSLAVLPFRVLSAAEDAAFFGEGIAEDLIIELSREADLFVVARQSSFQFRDDITNVTETGAKLGVQFLLGGSIRLAADNVRVTTHLLRCVDGQEIWAERFDRKLDDIFDIQTQIARTVSSTVIGRITSVGGHSPPNRRPEDLKAYELVMRGTQQMNRNDEDGVNAAIASFQSAIDLDPNYGRAYGLGALASAYRSWNYRVNNDVTEAMDWAQKAARLDPLDSKAQCALGFCYMVRREYDRAQFHFESGLQMNPNDDLLLIEYARFLFYIDRTEDSLRRIREAMRLNPYHPNWYWNIQGRCLHTLGRYAEALAAFEAISNPPFYVNLYMAACYRKLEMKDRFLAARDKIFELRPDFNMHQFSTIFPYKSEEVANKFWESLEAALKD
ncbi:BTAD domain-containing putative transcriptional regulator [Pseudohalocynthiibacter aestuariivivens]|uniref:BTAD domain-containing putative transcriptional regulator n=1 Tax=Pseudohalocynthiibacter aestuariivivens TaxID=1591409 RepID=A0ABV5JDB6_9RHOB|nr:BTAD domain-containing putative transcriptional regulator [Pseudohalocynthiibacter aestuariivivens]MBS9718832.1 tetratricopeptide repeat protein [Pseudohalocynthiibacter aestuariivivens]